VGRIKRGGGDGGEPARSPPGRLEFSLAAQSRLRLRSLQACRGTVRLGTPALFEDFLFCTEVSPKAGRPAYKSEVAISTRTFSIDP